MGLFGFGKNKQNEAKEERICVACGNEIGRFTHKPIKDGELCSNCALEIEEWWTLPLQDATSEICKRIVKMKSIPAAERKYELRDFGDYGIYADIFSCCPLSSIEEDADLLEKLLEKHPDAWLLEGVVLSGTLDTDNEVTVLANGEKLQGKIVLCTDKDVEIGSFAWHYEHNAIYNTVTEDECYFILLELNDAADGKKIVPGSLLVK